MLSLYVTRRLAIAGTSFVLVASVATGITIINSNKSEPQVKGVATTKAAPAPATQQNKPAPAVKAAGDAVNTSVTATKPAQNSSVAAKKPAPASTTPAKSSVTAQAVASAPASGTPNTPTSPVVTPPTPQCPECGGDPDKVISHYGTLILSANTFTIAAGNAINNLVVAHSDSGEAITIAYPMFTPGTPMIATISPNQITYAASQTFGFAVSQGVAPGTYQLKLRATSQTQGEYTANATVIVTPAL